MRAKITMSIPAYAYNTLYKHSLRNGGRICDINKESGITIPIPKESERTINRISHYIRAYVPFSTAHSINSIKTINGNMFKIWRFK